MTTKIISDGLPGKNGEITMSEKTATIDVKGIVMEYLKAHGYDGLYNPDIECGCGLDDFCPCDDGPNRDCIPAFHHKCNECRDGYKSGEESCEWREYGDGCYKPTAKE